MKIQKLWKPCLAALLLTSAAVQADEVNDPPVTTEPTTTEPAPATKPATKPKTPRKYDGEDKAKPTTAKTPRVKGTAYVRVLHAVVGAPDADIYLDGKIVLTKVAFKDVSKYLPVTTGKHALKITETGKTDALLTGSASFNKDKFYTVAAFGEAGNTDASKPAFLNINESTGKETASSKGKARVFVTHLAPGAPTVDITTPSKNKKGYASFLTKVEYAKKRSKTAKAATTILQVRADGKVIKEIADVKLEADHRYSVFAVGKVGGEGDSAFDVIVKPAATQ